MEPLGCPPNAVTCGCLMHHMFRRGRGDLALEVMEYMKRERIRTNEVMTTSLIKANNEGGVESVAEREEWQKVLDVYFTLQRERKTDESR